LTPFVDGMVHHFESRGLYNGVSILWDEETGTIWNHITGEAVYGPLAGARLPVYNLLHTTVEAALDADSDLEIAISERPIRVEGNFLERVFKRLTGLNDRFQGTMAREDTRRATMEVGIGVWESDAAKYYAMEDVLDAGEVIVDRLNGRGVVVYVEPTSRALAALYANAAGARWEDGELRLDTGHVFRRGALFDESGERQEIERPLQVFTRWYGFALTFPETEIYEP
jgi:hypothetical protein